MQGNLPLNLFLRARDFRASEATTDDYTDTPGICPHRFLDGLLHSAAERDTLLQLFRDTAAHQISIQLRLANLHDVQTDTFLGQVLQLSTQFINFGAATANYNTRLGRVNRHRHLIRCCALDLDARNRSVEKLFVNDLAQLEIFCEQILIIALSVPAGLPAFYDAKPETNGMYFMSQAVLLLA
jgi:hypothetical protein